MYEFDSMYKDKHALTRLAHEHLRRNGYEYPHGQSAPEGIIEMIELEARADARLEGRARRSRRTRVAKLTLNGVEIEAPRPARRSSR